MFDFGGQGQAQSQGYAFRACNMWGAEIRVSYFVVLYLGYQLYTALQRYAHAGGSWILFGLVSAGMQFALLYLTVLVHEFGHGTMSRRLGGRIDHILLWPFGGICFSSRPEEADVRQLVKNDFKVVAAGPATHFPQIACWLIVEMLVIALLNNTSPCVATRVRSMDGTLHRGCFPCEGIGCIKVILNPFGRDWGHVSPSLYPNHLGSFLLFYMPLMAINLNLMLFMFNVFFPMYPADGAKLLTSSLMYFCNVKPYRAGGILIACSGSCAVLLIAWAAYSFQRGMSGVFSGGQGAGMSAFSGVLPGLMGLMALQETCKIYNLRRNLQLSQHPCFRAARTDIYHESDRVARLNNTGRDNPDQAFGNTSGIEGSGCFLCRCPCFPWRRRDLVCPESTIQITVQPADPEAAQRMRDNRENFLTRVADR